jgi:very-short-patch-repair endonuclease
VPGIAPTESAIEQMLAEQLIGPAQKWGYEIIPQFKIENYRYDFAIKNTTTGRVVAVVECDGRDFHSTPEQLENDARKDELARQHGFSMFRRTGSDIAANPVKCAEQIIFQVFPR